MTIPSDEGILILGAGGHGKVVASTLLAMGETLRGFLDDNPKTHGVGPLGIPILGDTEMLGRFGPRPRCILALGTNEARRNNLLQLRDRVRWVRAIHPSAILAEGVVVQEGTVVFAGAILQADTIVGAHCIVNTGTTVDHDCRIGAFSHLAPGCHLAGGVTLGEGAFLGVGTNAIPGTMVGDWSIVGAGSTIIRDIPPGVVAVGSPAHPIRNRKDHS